MLRLAIELTKDEYAKLERAAGLDIRVPDYMRRVALAVAALRHGATARWVGWVGAVLGGVTLLLGLSPLQYMAGMTGPIWLLVTALGLALGDRARRA